MPSKVRRAAIASSFKTSLKNAKLVRIPPTLYSVKRAFQAIDRRAAIGRPGRELRQQRIVIERNSPALVDAGIEPDARARGLGKMRDFARRRQKLFSGSSA